MFEHTIQLQRFREGEDPAGQAKLWLDAGRIAARQGDTEAARRLLRSAVQASPGCVDAWLRLAWVTPDRRERRSLLRRVLALDPGHRQARAELEHLERQLTPQPVPTPRTDVSLVPAAPPRVEPAGAKDPSARRWTLAVLLLFALAFLDAVLIWGPVDANVGWLLPTPTPTPRPPPTQTPQEIIAGFVPQLKTAITEANWKRAFDIIDIMASLDPTSDQVRLWTVDTRVQYGQALVQERDLPAADGQFAEALALAPGDATAQFWQQVVRSYQAGEQAVAAGDWDAAIEAFSQVQNKRPGTLDTTDLLAQSYRKRGIARQEARQLKEARADLEEALALQPDDAEAKTHLDQVMLVLFPPKRIEIDISAQRFYAYEGDTLVYSFLTSTGLPGRDTAPGHFKVLDKIPMAYSSIWRLKMPYWLGIYYVGRVENGIHALPIRPDGTVMWGGLLGTRQSYGCVILSTEAAATIYEWAEVGTVVDIHY